MNKRIILIIILVLMVVGLDYLVHQQSSWLNFLKLNKSNMPNSQPTSNQNVEDWKVYKNTKYGFQLTFTQVWQGFRAREETKPGGVDYDTIHFEVPDAEGHKGFELLMDINI